VKNTSEYFEFTRDMEIQAKAKTEAAAFVRGQQQFQLGYLPTEQAHPYTRNFSGLVQEKPEEGISLLFKVDGDLPPVARRVFLDEPYNRLVTALDRVLTDNRRICFSGCGSTGRLAMMLEVMWRQYWEDQAGAPPGTAARNLDTKDENLGKANLACSLMTGGDRALIRAVENFEDFSQFGRRQVADQNLSPGDVLVAVSEGGETSSVIGTVEEALDRGCQVFFIFNNPTSLLEKNILRSRRVIENPAVTVIDLFSGPMALSGSTRMQATTLEMHVIGSAMEEVFLSRSGKTFTIADRLAQADRLASLVQELDTAGNRAVMAEVAVREAQIYRQGGRVTYLASRFLLDIFSDTTERSPTFMLPPFRPGDDCSSAVSWAYAKDPTRSSENAWFDMLRHAPRGLDWTGEDYRVLGAADKLIENPPALGAREISRYLIGKEEDPSRTEKEPFWILRVGVGNTAVPGEEGTDQLLIGGSDPVGASAGSARTLLIGVTLPESPVMLWHHLSVKLVFNTISTASMGIMGRIRGNWMVQLDPTNKKLIDRGSRIIAHLTGLPYDKACKELFLSLLSRERLKAAGGDSTTSPVVDALDRIQGEDA